MRCLRLQPFYSTERITELVKDVEADLQKILGEEQGVHLPASEQLARSQHLPDCEILGFRLFKLKALMGQPGWCLLSRWAAPGSLSELGAAESESKGGTHEEITKPEGDLSKAAPLLK